MFLLSHSMSAVLCHSFALAMVNNGNTTATVACDAGCFASLLDGAAPAAKYLLC